MSQQGTLSAVVVDDELHARENLRMLLHEFCEGIEVVGDARDIDEAEKKIAQLSPDVLFLDIRMPSGSEGFELLQRVDTSSILVVFVTAFKDYAINAFKANAIHYILKPVDIDDLQEAVAKIKAHHKAMHQHPENREHYRDSLKEVAGTMLKAKKSERITLYHSKGFKVVQQADIIRLQAENNCTWLHMKTGESYLDTRTLKFYEEILDKDRFFRTHKSHIINLDQLVEYLHTEGHTAVLASGDQVPVARARLSSFLSQVKLR